MKKPSRKTIRTEADTDRSLVNAKRRLMLELAEREDDSIACMFYSKAQKVA